MKIIISTALVCATAVFCAWMVLQNISAKFVPSTVAVKEQPPHYSLHQFEERFVTGYSEKSIFRLDETTGKVWRLNKVGYQVKGNKSPLAVEGWDEIHASFEDEFRAMASQFPLELGASPAPTP